MPSVDLRPHGSAGTPPGGTAGEGISRRRFMGYLIAGSTLIAAAPQFVSPATARAALPTHQPIDDYDLSDLLNEAAAPTSGLISITVNTDGTVSFALPRAEVGQGITTAVAMTLADEMGIGLDQVTITLADARPELIWNQLTGGSNSMHSIFIPVRVAAAIARHQLVEAAALVLQEPAYDLTVVGDQVTAPSGGSIGLGALAKKAAVTSTRAVQANLRSDAQFTLIGTPQTRIDGLDIVTGRKQFALDLDVPNALPTMVCRPPTINGTAARVNNLAQVEAMPGITDVVLIPHTQFVAGGVAVRGQTFGQCIDAIRALDVAWEPGAVGTPSESDVLAELDRTELPLTPALPTATTIEEKFTFHFRPGDPLEPNTAIADVTPTSAEVWSCLKSPIWCKEQLVTILGLPLDAITVHVAQGGGSFGRHLFSDAAFEAAAISQKLGKPVKLMWARTDNFRQNFLRDPRLIAVLNKAAEVGNWGRAMPAGTAQGIAVHSEYKSAGACLIEIDCRPQTVNRTIPDAYTGPRVTKALYVVDVGLPINPMGLEAQMLGGMMDGIAHALTFSLHLKDGYFLEGSWDNAYYTREWNAPFETQVIVMPPSTGIAGGAGELGVAPAMAATACAYLHATGTTPTEFPINHSQPLGFTPYPTVPPIPQSPTDGLTYAY